MGKPEELKAHNVQSTIPTEIISRLESSQKALKASEEKRFQIESEKRLLELSLKENEINKTLLEKSEYNTQLVEAKLQLTNMDLQEANETVKRLRELIAEKNNSIRVSNVTLEETTQKCAKLDNRIRMLRDKFKTCKELLSVSESKVSEYSEANSKMVQSYESTISVQRETIKHLMKDNQNISENLREVALSNLEQVQENTNLKSVISEYKPIELVIQVTLDQPPQELKALEPMPSQIKSEKKTPFKREDWSKLKNFKFSGWRDPTIKGSTLERLTNQVIQYINTVPPSMYIELSGFGILGYYFNAQIRDYLDGLQKLPSSSKA